MLDSALAVPQAGFGGHHLHGFPYGMAAAYAYHLAENQPFVDGNKRTAIVTALAFLDACKIDLDDEAGVLYQAMKDISAHKLSKEGLATLLESLASSK